MLPAQALDHATGHLMAAAALRGLGDLSLISPPGALDGVPLRWEHGPRPIGGDAPRWRPGGLH